MSIPTYLPETLDIRGAFEEEIAAAGGEVRDVYDDGDRLFLRSVLPMVEEVRPHDAIRAGVALRAAGSRIHTAWQLLTARATGRSWTYSSSTSPHSTLTRLRGSFRKS